VHFQILHKLISRETGKKRKPIRDIRLCSLLSLETYLDTVAYREGTVSWIPQHLDTSSASLNPVSERRSEFRYTVALPRGAQLVNTPPPSAGGREKAHKRRRQEVGKTRRQGERRLDWIERAGTRWKSRSEREKRREESTCEKRSGRVATSAPPAGRPVIYRAEPSPSLTPLLRNYTQSMANKSKKVSATLVPIHETNTLVRRLALLRRFRPVLARSPTSPLLSRSVRTFAANSIEILVQIASYAPESLRCEIARDPLAIARFKSTLLIFAVFVRLRELNQSMLNL